MVIGQILNRKYSETMGWTPIHKQVIIPTVIISKLYGCPQQASMYNVINILGDRVEDKQLYIHQNVYEFEELQILQIYAPCFTLNQFFIPLVLQVYFSCFANSFFYQGSTTSTNGLCFVQQYLAWFHSNYGFLNFAFRKFHMAERFFGVQLGSIIPIHLGVLQFSYQNSSVIECITLFKLVTAV